MIREHVLADVVAIRLLATLTARGVALMVAGDVLRYAAPPDVLTPDLLAALRAHKDAILALLTDVQPVPTAYAARHTIGWAGEPLPANAPRPGWPCTVCGYHLWSTHGGQPWYCGNCGQPAGILTPAWPCLHCGGVAWAGEPGRWHCTGCGAAPGADWRRTAQPERMVARHG